VVLDDVSLRLEAGSHLAVFGPNGAGKTTLLRLLSLLDKPAKGTVEYVRDGEVLEMPEARSQIGFITHASMLYPDLTALQNLELFAGLYGVADPTKRAYDLLDEVGLSHRSDDAVRSFSRGMVQRMAFVRALVNNPAVLLMDEPYAGLDPRGAELVRGVLSSQADRRITVEVSHDLEAGLQAATHVLILARGKQVMFGAKDELGPEAIRECYAQVLQGGAR
jgi:heme exporter protein A